MSINNSGRHRAAGRFSPVAELSDIVAKSAQPAVKTSAILVASGGLVASFALPASAATSGAPAAPAAAPTAVTAPAAASPATGSSFGVIGFAATAKPKPAPQPVAPRAQPAQRAQPAPRASRAAVRPAIVTAPTTAPVIPATGGVLNIAASLAGIMYRWGGTSPDTGFDCSGFTQYVFHQVGINLPRTAEEQRQFATPVSNPQPGDLVFFGAPAYHMGIYAGNGKMWDSPRSGQAVALRDIWSTSVTYGRP